MVKKIGILTGGGDCGGLNGVIKEAALMAVHQGLKSYLIPNGYAGLYNLLDFGTIPELPEHRIDQIDANLAGSDAGHSRVKVNSIRNPDLMIPFNPHIKYYEGDKRGYFVATVTPKQMRLDLRLMSSVKNKNGTGHTEKSFVVLDGEPGLYQILKYQGVKKTIICR